MTHQEIIASAIANGKLMRNGVPPIANVLDILPESLLEEVNDQAENVLKELENNGLIINAK